VTIGLSVGATVGTGHCAAVPAARDERAGSEEDEGQCDDPEGEGVGAHAILDEHESCRAVRSSFLRASSSIRP
jgi:hypothetical protein